MSARALKNMRRIADGASRLVPMSHPPHLELAQCPKTGGKSAVAAKPFIPGTLIATYGGVRVERPSSHSLQLDKDTHVLAQEENIAQYVNHACEPNAIFIPVPQLLVAHLVAIEYVEAGEHVTFNYNTTEYSMQESFNCKCGAPTCDGEIRGYAHLPPQRQKDLRPLCVPHLLTLDVKGDVAL